MSGSCCYLAEHVHKVLEYVFLEVYNKFPDRQDRLVNVGDATPTSGSCSGHPGTSHSGLKALDLDYYTHETNVTQYGIVPTIIWDNNGLLVDVFDWERNYLLWEHIYSIFPESLGTVDRRIREYMLPLVASNFGLDAYEEFRTHIQGDDPEHYNHHLHIHFRVLSASAEQSLGDEINYNYVVE